MSKAAAGLERAAKIGIFYFVGKWLWQPVLRPTLWGLGLLFVFAVIFGETSEAMKPHLPQSEVPMNKIHFSADDWSNWTLTNDGDHPIGNITVKCRATTDLVKPDDPNYYHSVFAERVEAHSSYHGHSIDDLSGSYGFCEIEDGKYAVYTK